MRPILTTSPPRVALLAATLAVAAGLALPAGALAQEAPRFRVGAGVGVSLLVGEGGSDFLDSGVSQWLGAAVRIDRGDHLHLRVEASRTPLVPDDDPPSGARADNTVYLLAAGPEVSATFGSLRPYAGALAGVAVGRWETEEGSTERSGSESSFGWGGQAGAALEVGGGARPVAFVAEARLFDPGALLFARAPAGSGGPLTGTTRADVAVLSLRVGVTLGF